MNENDPVGPADLGPVSPADFGLDPDEAARLVGLAARYDPVPDHVLAGARAAFSWRTVDAELAELVYDSAADDEALAGVRSGPGGARQLTFEGPSLAVEVEVASAGRLVGQLVPPGPARVEVRHPERTVAVEADGLGRFAADVPPGPVSLLCRPAAGEAQPHETIRTDWVVL